MPQANSLRNIPILDLSRTWIGTSVFIGGVDPSAGKSGLAPTDAQLLRLSYEASLTPLSRGYVVLDPPPCRFLSSLSLRRSTRCRHASAIRSSCSWIRSSKPLDVSLRCADHVSMFCRRNCVRLQRGSSVRTGTERKVLKPFIQSLQAGCTSRGATGGQRWSGETLAALI